jgi:two-component system LytT family response regulator
MKCILIDDEQKAREMLRILLEKNFPEIEIVGETSNIPEGVKLIHRLHPDVVFLDIEMPIYSGLEILDFFDKEHIHFKIIFVTAYAEHALKAFRLAAVDYLLKPIQLSQLSEAVTKLKKNETVSVQQLDALQHNLSGGKAERIALSLSEGLTIVELKDILYLKAEGSYTNVVLSGGKKILISKVLGEFAFLTEHHSFFRTNRSFIINIEKVKRIGRNGNEVILEGEIDIPVTPERKSDLLDLFKNIRI